MKYFICLLISLNFTSSVYAADICSMQKITGFTTVKMDKAYFYKQAIPCKPGSKCLQKKKAYIVKDNFVQVGESSGEFVCTLYHNYNGWGGKKSIGWLLKADLKNLETKLKLVDILGSWYKDDCDGDDSCIITIGKETSEKYVIDGTSYLHDHPSMILKSHSSQKEESQLIVQGEIIGLEKELNFKVIYNNDSLEPGTILLKDASGFSGVYHR